MSIERELLKRAKLLMECSDLIEGTLIESKSPALIKEIEEILAQPEQESVYQKLSRIEDGIEIEILPSELWQDGYETGKRTMQPEPEPNKDMTLFCVTAYRWGDREKHSYVVGVFDDLERAIHYAKAEEEWRGGKYECEVISMPLNASKQNRQHKVEYKIDGGVEYEKL